jgi:hypothetical protein
LRPKLGFCHRHFGGLEGAQVCAGGDEMFGHVDYRYVNRVMLQVGENRTYRLKT